MSRGPRIRPAGSPMTEDTRPSIHDGWTPEPQEQVQPGDPWRDTRPSEDRLRDAQAFASALLSSPLLGPDDDIPVPRWTLAALVAVRPSEDRLVTDLAAIEARDASWQQLVTGHPRADYICAIVADDRHALLVLLDRVRTLIEAASYHRNYRAASVDIAETLRKEPTRD